MGLQGPMVEQTLSVLYPYLPPGMYQAKGYLGDPQASYG